MKDALAESRGFGAEIDRMERDIPDGAPAWLRTLRHGALARFRALGFPGPRDEEWRQTSVSAIAATRFLRPDSSASVESSAFDRLRFSGSGALRLVFVNGRFAPALSSAAGLPPGVRAGSLGAALSLRPEAIEPHLGRIATFEDRAFAALNTALFEDGALVEVAPGTVLPAPLHVVHVATDPGFAAVSHPRILLILGDGAEAQIVESYLALGGGTFLTNAVSEVVLGDDAALTHVRVQNESLSAFHVGTVQFRLGRTSRLLSLNVHLGDLLARTDIGAVLAGAGAEVTLNGLYVADRSRHVDNHTTIDHAVRSCTSHEMYKGVLSGSARAVFNGRIVVRPDAQKTDAKQSNRNLLLSSDAVVHTRPQLEIHANDVKCTHGATIGHLDDDALFYLRSRGIGSRDARHLLVRAFTGEVLTDLRIAALREALEQEVIARLDRALAEEAP